MPLKDKTGPEGKGPLTGRKLGKCNEDNDKDLSDDIVKKILGKSK